MKKAVKVQKTITISGCLEKYKTWSTS